MPTSKLPILAIILSALLAAGLPIDINPELINDIHTTTHTTTTPDDRLNSRRQLEQGGYSPTPSPHPHFIDDEILDDAESHIENGARATFHTTATTDGHLNSHHRLLQQGRYAAISNVLSQTTYVDAGSSVSTIMDAVGALQDDQAADDSNDYSKCEGFYAPPTQEEQGLDTASAILGVVSAAGSAAGAMYGPAAAAAGLFDIGVGVYNSAIGLQKNDPDAQDALDCSRMEIERLEKRMEEKMRALKEWVKGQFSATQDMLFQLHVGHLIDMRADALSASRLSDQLYRQRVYGAKLLDPAGCKAGTASCMVTDCTHDEQGGASDPRCTHPGSHVWPGPFVPNDLQTMYGRLTDSASTSQKLHDMLHEWVGKFTDGSSSFVQGASQDLRKGVYDGARHLFQAFWWSYANHMQMSVQFSDAITRTLRSRATTHSGSATANGCRQSKPCFEPGDQFCFDLWPDVPSEFAAEGAIESILPAGWDIHGILKWLSPAGDEHSPFVNFESAVRDFVWFTAVHQFPHRSDENGLNMDALVNMDLTIPRECLIGGQECLIKTAGRALEPCRDEPRSLGFCYTVPGLDGDADVFPHTDSQHMTAVVDNLEMYATERSLLFEYRYDGPDDHPRAVVAAWPTCPDDAPQHTLCLDTFSKIDAVGTQHTCDEDQLKYDDIVRYPHCAARFFSDDWVPGRLICGTCPDYPSLYRSSSSTDYRIYPYCRCENADVDGDGEGDGVPGFLAAGDECVAPGRSGLYELPEQTAAADFAACQEDLSRAREDAYNNNMWRFDAAQSVLQLAKVHLVNYTIAHLLAQVSPAVVKMHESVSPLTQLAQDEWTATASDGEATSTELLPVCNVDGGGRHLGDLMLQRNMREGDTRCVHKATFGAIRCCNDDSSCYASICSGGAPPTTRQSVADPITDVRNGETNGWDQASSECFAHGGRLCTADESENCDGTGCGYDSSWVWTDTSCTQEDLDENVVLPETVAPTVAPTTPSPTTPSPTTPSPTTPSPTTPSPTTPFPTPHPTPAPTTPFPTPYPTAIPTPSPPTPNPTAYPTSYPTASPTSYPTAYPTSSPSTSLSPGDCCTRLSSSASNSCDLCPFNSEFKLWGTCLATTGGYRCMDPPDIVLPPVSDIMPQVGRQVLDGGSGKFPTSTCISAADLSSATTIARKSGGQQRRIATQCCTASNECRRRTSGLLPICFSGPGNSAGSQAITARTFKEAEALCEANGLELCEQDCKNAGCAYNSYPVFSKLTC